MREVYHIPVKTIFVGSPDLPQSKVCPVCEKDKPLDQYTIHKGRGHRTGRYEVRCKECVRAADRERNRKRRPLKGSPKIQEEPRKPVLATKQCIICGGTKPLPAFAQLRSSPDKRSADCKECREQKNSVIVQFSLFFKVCPGCNIDKCLETDFHKGPKGIGYRKYCIACSREHRMKQYYECPEINRQYAQRRKTNPEYIEYHREKERMRYNTNPAVAQKAKESAKAYQKANPLKRREHASRREARKKGNRVGAVNYKHILERDGCWCYICSQPIDPNTKEGPGKLAFDHVVPLVPRPGEPQGEHSADNIRPTHHICNSRKKNKPFHLLNDFDRHGP